MFLPWNAAASVTFLCALDEELPRKRKTSANARSVGHFQTWVFSASQEHTDLRDQIRSASEGFHLLCRRRRPVGGAFRLLLLLSRLRRNAEHPRQLLTSIRLSVQLREQILPTCIFILAFFLTVGYFLANFKRPVLGCIETHFCK